MMRLNTFCLLLLLAGCVPGVLRAQETENEALSCPAPEPPVSTYIAEDSLKRIETLGTEMKLLGPGQQRYRLPAKPDKVFRRVGKPRLFVPQGQWMLSGSVSFNNHNLKNYQFLIIKNWEGDGYIADVKATVAYTIFDNMTVGAKFGYSRTYVDMKSADLNLSEDLNFEIRDFYTITQMYYGTAFMRNYLSIAQSRRFALFNDLEIRYGYGTGKIINGLGEKLEGTYQKINDFEIGICPGLLVFMNNNVAFEVSMEMLGFQVRHTSQLTNQVEHGSRRKTAAKFGVNLFSIKLGATVYFNGRNRNINEKYKDR